jgi:hypothetical protein
MDSRLIYTGMTEEKKCKKISGATYYLLEHINALSCKKRRI